MSAHDTLATRLALFDQADLYPVISSEFCDGRAPEAVLLAVARGGAKMVQMREKNVSDRERLALAKIFRRITDDFGMLLIIDDRVDIALSVGADGVHLGQDDLPLEAARALAPELILGISTHSAQQAVATFRAGASYVNIGPIFATQTKTLSMQPVGLDAITEALTCEPNLRFSCMGGIKEDHLPMLRKLGVRHAAMVTQITRAADVEAQTRALRAVFTL